MGFLTGLVKSVASVALTPVAMVVDVAEEVLDVKDKSNSTNKTLSDAEKGLDEIVEEGIGKGKII